jgi:thiamine-phosphate pyrophosphorylase
VDWIQIREKDLAGKDCSSLTLEALQRTAKSAANKIAPARVLVNDRLDVALSQKAGGVHLGENSLPLAEAKRLVDAHGGTPDFLVGVSCHSLEAARAAAASGADYLFFGPVFATPSKAAFGAPQGRTARQVCGAVPSQCTPLAESCRMPPHVLLQERRESRPFVFFRTLPTSPPLFIH